MARRLLPLLTLLVLAAFAPGSAAAATDLHGHSHGGGEPETGKEALREAKALMRGEDVRTGREVTLALRTLVEKLPQLDGADRRRAERLLARPTQGEANPNEATYDVPEAPPLDGPHFRIHYVNTVSAAGARPAPPGACRNPADDRPPLTDSDASGVPDYVEMMLAEFENVYRVQNERMGWRPPKPDFGRGGNDKTDVYIKNIGPEGIFGYAAPDATQPLNEGRNKLAAYLVMDNDYCQAEFRNYPNFLEPLQVTAAHEYNHILQFNYDALQDNWMFESTAVWMEDEVYDAINDYRNYLPVWAGDRTGAPLTLSPLTRFDQQPAADNPNNAKAYGDVVFVRWVAARYGADSIRSAWEQSIRTGSFAPGAYDAALRPRGTDMFGVFTGFAPDTAEWRLANGPFEEGAEEGGFPDVARALRGTALRPQTATRNRNDYVEGGIDHLSYALFNVDPQGQDRITVGATFNRGVKGAVALVGRTGDDRGGAYTVRIKRMPRGGVGRVTLDGAAGFTRVTAVLMNGDTSVARNADGSRRYDRQIADWVWLGDDEPVTLAVNDFTTPRVRRYAPRRSASRVSPRTALKLVFDEGVAGIADSDDARNVRLIGPGGRRVRLRSTQSRDGRTVRLRPARRLARGKRYTVKLGSAVTDAGGNRLRRSQRIWRFTTRR
jgi:hypothetical protein